MAENSISAETARKITELKKTEFYEDFRFLTYYEIKKVCNSGLECVEVKADKCISIADLKSFIKELESQGYRGEFKHGVENKIIIRW